MEKIAEHKSFVGKQLRYRHRAQSVGCDMTFSIYLPPQAELGKVPVLYWLSGLTCTDENFVNKAGAQHHASMYGMAIVAPDTSPRGDGVADAEDGAYDLGLGAGFYLNARRSPWSQHYRMEDYFCKELVDLVESEFPVDGKRSAIAGHSMGGHGALKFGLKYPERFRSISAFAPISSASNCPWGKKALTAYLGDDPSLWAAEDCCELLKKRGNKAPKILVDQGDADPFLQDQLKPELLQAAATAGGADLTLRMQSGYDHSYFFIASFIEEHLRFHREHVG